MKAQMCSTSQGLLVVISGPSGVGKTTIARHVERRLGGVFSVSVTTRPQSVADVQGRDYFFIDLKTFEQMRDEGELLEWAEVFGKYNYGTPRRAVEEQLAAGRLVILEIDVQGGLQIREKCPDAFLLFVLPPSDDELLRRLQRRGRDSEDAIQRRYATAKKEIETARQSGAYDEFIVNDSLEHAVQRACELIEQRWKQTSKRQNVETSQ